MTDVLKYIGFYKERFDESGKGKGLEGCKDFDDKVVEGYVGGYKGKDIYDKTYQLRDFEIGLYILIVLFI